MGTQALCTGHWAMSTGHRVPGPVRKEAGDESSIAILKRLQQHGGAENVTSVAYNALYHLTHDPVYMACHAWLGFTWNCESSVLLSFLSPLPDVQVSSRWRILPCGRDLP